ncbi:MAG: hypothetical protein ACLP70_03000 [Streptosporangiaceae bacterium]
MPGTSVTSVSASGAALTAGPAPLPAGALLSGAPLSGAPLSGAPLAGLTASAPAREEIAVAVTGAPEPGSAVAEPAAAGTGDRGVLVSEGLAVLVTGDLSGPPAEGFAGPAPGDSAAVAAGLLAACFTADWAAGTG